MKVSKELNDALEAVAKEVDTWPAWKRSIDLHAHKKPTEALENKDSLNEVETAKRKTSHLTRAAKA